MNPIVEVVFRIQGDVIPVDHGYHLFSALSKNIPWLHSNEMVAIANFSGQKIGKRQMRLTQWSLLAIRLPADSVRHILPLAGQSISIGDFGSVRIGVPHTRGILPSPDLSCPLVIIKGFLDPEPFLFSANKHLLALGINGKASLIERRRSEEKTTPGNPIPNPVVRRTIKIKDKTVVGFAVKVENLSPLDSVILQEKGLGGRRRFGCGIFVPFQNGGK